MGGQKQLHIFSLNGDKGKLMGYSDDVGAAVCAFEAEGIELGEESLFHADLF